MSTLTNYNVKVALDIANPGFTEDKAVIFDLSENKFVLGTAGSTGVIAKTNPATAQVATATTLTFTNGKITANGNEAIIDSVWFTAANYNWGGQSGIASTSGFILNGSDAFTHVTPRRSQAKTALLGIPRQGANEFPLAYPDNYIVYTSVSTTEDDGSSGSGGTEGQELCAGGLFADLDLSSLAVGDVVTPNDTILGNFAAGGNPLIVESGNQVVIVVNGVGNENNIVYGSVTSVNNTAQDYSTVIEITVSGVPPGISPSTSDKDNYCLSVLPEVLTLTIGNSDNGQGGQLAITQPPPNVPSGSFQQGGLLLTSSPSIYFFEPFASSSNSGSFIIPSASAQINFNPVDRSLSFLTGNKDTQLTNVLYVSKSGEDARVGIGTTNPIQAFDVQETKDDSTGTQLLLRSTRTATKGADPGDAAGSINFIIASGSYNNITESGSIAKITSEVITEGDEGVTGKLIFQTANNPKVSGSTVMQLFNNGCSITSSLDVSSFLSADKIAVGGYVVNTVPTNGIGILGDIINNGNATLGLTDADLITIRGDLQANEAVQFNNLPVGSETTFLTVDGSGNVKTRTSGADGSSGTSGTSGSSGTSGTSGSSGTSGTSGSSGSSGTSGVTGGTGAAGSSGTSGTSGVINVTNSGNNRILTDIDGSSANAEANLTFDGSDLTVSGDIEAESILVKTTGISSQGDYGAGSRIYIGSDVGTISAGKVYYLASTGWELSNSSAESTAGGFLAVRTSTGTTSVSGMLIEGVIKVGTNLSSSNVGDKIYLLNANGALTTTLPTTSGLYVRIIGYVVTPSTSVIYFNPSPDYIELA